MRQMIPVPNAQSFIAGIGETPVGKLPGMSAVEIQATAEKGSYSRTQFNNLLDLAEAGLKQIFAAQRAVLA